MLCRRRTVCRDMLFTVFCQSRRQTKSTKVGTDISSEWDEIWQIDMRGLAVHQGHHRMSFGPQGPLGHQNTEECKKNCNTFLVHGSAERDEVWHDEAQWCVADLKGFL